MNPESDLGKFFEAKRQEIIQALKQLSPSYKEAATAKADAKAAIRHGQSEAWKTRHYFQLSDADPLAIGLTASGILWSLLEWQWAVKHPAYQKPPIKQAVDELFRNQVNRRLSVWHLTINDPTAGILISCLDEVAELLLNGLMLLKDYIDKSYFSESVSQRRRQTIINTTMDDVVEKVQEFRELESRWLPLTHKYV